MTQRWKYTQHIHTRSLTLENRSTIQQELVGQLQCIQIWLIFLFEQNFQAYCSTPFRIYLYLFITNQQLQRCCHERNVTYLARLLFFSVVFHYTKLIFFCNHKVVFFFLSFSLKKKNYRIEMKMVCILFRSIHIQIIFAV